MKRYQVLLLLLVGSTLSSFCFGRDPKILCDRTWYTSESCPCTADEPCGYEGCEQNGGGVACLEKLRTGTGTISGMVKNPYLRRTAAVIHVEKVDGHEFQLPDTNPVMDQINLTFTPHILPILVGSTVAFPNSDEVRHNVFSTPKASKVFNLGSYPVGHTEHVTFDELGVSALLCNVHAEMSGYVVILQNPYFAMTEADYSFTIRHVPPGEYELSLWHEKLRKVSVPITVTAGQVTEAEFPKKLKRK